MTTSSPDLSTTLAGIRLSTCVYNASGPRSGSAEALRKIAQSSAGAVLSKSATLTAQDGNPQPRTWQHKDASLNSEGLPNKGIDYYMADETITEVLQDIEKPYMVSLSGKTTADNMTMLRKLQGNTKIASIELNLACPNIIGKPVVGYDLEQMKDILDQVAALTPNLPPLGIKLPPYLDSVQFQQVTHLINQYRHCVQYVVSINTLGNATAVSIDAGMPYISSNDGFAGLSGPAVKYTALANVRKLRQLLHPTIAIVGVGGIVSGRDVLEFVLCGATAVQVGTQHWTEGPACFDRIVHELNDLMQELGHDSVASLVGTLQPWNKEGAAKLRAVLQKEKQSAKHANTTSSSSSSGGGRNEGLYQIVSIVLLMVAFVLLADKFALFGTVVERTKEL